MLGCGIKIGMKIPQTLLITYDGEKWDLGTLDEFFTKYSNSDNYRLQQTIGSNSIVISGDKHTTNIQVGSYDINLIHSIFQVLETNLEKGKIEEEPSTETESAEKPIRIFIGHGSDGQWRNLKDHLQDKHGYKIEAYEIGSRAGQSIKDILESMLVVSSFALLVLTGEDIDKDGDLHARENVIHELGLFQGKLGFNRAIALLEKGTIEFSNIHGIHQLRFSKGNIKEIYGDIVATINREFK